ncbi:MAG: hypothetical protein WKF61_01820 [Luteimonas sp.]
MRRNVSSLLVASLLSTTLLAACGNKDAQDRGSQEAGESGLPTPQTTSGSVTGMPDAPGPGQASTISGLPPDTPIASDGSVGLPPIEGNPETGMAPGSPGTGDPLLTPEGLPRGEPGPSDAVDTIREYYANINSRSFGRAYVLWSGNGGGSGQSPQQFADGFADTIGISVEIQQPGAMDAAAGSRYIDVPVAVAATQRDGSLRKYVGTYRLRYSLVDGATPEQRNWRIGSADLREVQP